MISPTMALILHRTNLSKNLFIVGIESKEARCLIYQQNSETLTIDQWLHLVSSFESVSSGGSTVVSTFSSPSGEVTVNSVNTSRVQSSSWRCYGCGSSTYHSRSTCPAYKSSCHKCGKVGHFARVCKSQKGLTQKSIKALHMVNSDDEDIAVNSLQVNTACNL